MNISFQCPQGHALNAPSELAGRPGQCPKCGAKFVVPTNSEIANSAPITGSPSSGSGKGTSGSGSAKVTSGSGKAEVGSLPPGKFFFLCPNGHKLNGPVSLRGKPGQCPRCHSKFLIPESDETESADQSAQQSHGAAGTPPDSVPADQPLVVEPEAESFDLSAPEFADDEVPVTEVVDRWSATSSNSKSASAGADLFHWIWRQRNADSTVVLYLNDGQEFAVKQFAPALSRGRFAVFATPDETGKITISAIAWDQISRITVRELADYPQNLFQSGSNKSGS